MPLQETIKIDSKVKEELGSLAVERHETYNDIIVRLMYSHKRLAYLKEKYQKKKLEESKRGV